MLVTDLLQIGLIQAVSSISHQHRCSEVFVCVLIFGIFKSLFHWFVSYISDQNLKMFGDWWVGLNADFAQSHISTLKSKDILFQFRSSSPLLKSKTRDLVANKYSSISTFIEYVPICSIYLVISRQFHMIM